MLTIGLHPVARLRIGGNMSPLFLCAFISRKGMTYYYYYYYCYFFQLIFIEFNWIITILITLVCNKTLGVVGNKISARIKGHTFLVDGRCDGWVGTVSSSVKPEAAITFLRSWWWAVCIPKHVEQLRNTGIINSTTRLHLVGSFYEIYITMHGSMNIKLCN